ncbi:hypothetical protein D3C76_1384980 [compost metagenome]
MAVVPRMSGYHPRLRRMNGLVAWGNVARNWSIAWSFRRCEIWAMRILSCTSYGHRKTSRAPTTTSAPLTSMGSRGGLK